MWHGVAIGFVLVGWLGFVKDSQRAHSTAVTVLASVMYPPSLHTIRITQSCADSQLSDAKEWLEIKALRCEEQLREVIDFIRGFGSGQACCAGLATAAPEHVLQLFLGQHFRV